MAATSALTFYDLLIEAFKQSALNLFPSTSPRPVSGSRCYLVAKALDFADREVTLSNLSIRLCHAEHVCSFLIDRPGDTQPSHLAKQRGSFQSQFPRCAARSTDDPAGLLKCFQNQSAMRVFQGLR